MQATPLFSSETDLSRHNCYVAAMTLLATLAGALHTIAVGRGIIWTSKVSTGATDGVYIYINPAYFQALKNDLQRAFLIGHEVLHIVLSHMFRGKLFKDRGYFSQQLGWCHRTYNAAADYIINAMLVKMGFEMIEGGLLSDEFTANDIAEEVYIRLFNQKPEEPEDGQQGDESDDSDDDSDSDDDAENSGGSDESNDSDDESGDESDGSGDDSDESDDSDEDGDESDGDDDSDDGESGNEGESGGDDQDGDPTDDESGTGNPVPSEHDGHDDHLEPQYSGESDQDRAEQQKSDADEIQREIEQAIEQAEKEGQNVGDLKGATQAQGDAQVDPLADDWADHLEAYFTAKAREGQNDWSRINRRKFTLLGVVAPSYKGSVNRLAIIKDVSYSVCDRSLALFDVKIAELLDQVAPTEGTLVLPTSSRVIDSYDVYSGDEYLAADKEAGGGTYMSAGLDWIEENGESPDLTICFTDSDVWGDDLDRLAAAGVLLVIDTYESYVEAKSEILRSGIEFIVVNDRPA
jgi:predicted metal-dependent peptidase